MAFVIETGAGTPNANAYVTSAFVDAYLAERNRETENEWSTQTTDRKREAIVAATAYVEKRFGQRFRGSKRTTLIPGRASNGTLTLVSLPVVNETVTVGQIVYRFVATISQENDVARGASVAEAAENLASTIVGGGDGAVAHVDTRVNYEVLASAEGAVVEVEAQVAGASGDSVAFETDVTDATISGSGFLTGGIDDAPQPLSFPRRGAYDRDGNPIIGVPLALKQAVAEYAVRALEAELDPDPTTSETGAAIQRRREKVGPIEEETEYVEGAVLAVHRAYPAADELLAEFLSGGGVGGVYR